MHKYKSLLISVKNVHTDKYVYLLVWMTSERTFSTLTLMLFLVSLLKYLSSNELSLLSHSERVGMMEAAK
jgi:hypothetical protein